MRILLVCTIVTMPMVLSGCVAGKIITAPVRVAGTVIETAVDATTQTRTEKEEDIGRKILKKYNSCIDDADNKEEKQACRERYHIDG